jgi:pheromone shutdown protein TraB
LTKVPEEKLIQQLIKQLKQRYPSIYKVLIQERNKVIAKNLAALIKRNPEDKIVAVVGAGHETELVGLVGKKLLIK